jgi:chromosome partitioning protein
MYDDRTNLAQQVTDTLREYFRDRLFQTVIPRNVRLAEAPSHGKPVALYDPRSRGTEAYFELAGEYLARNGIESPRSLERKAPRWPSRPPAARSEPRSVSGPTPEIPSVTSPASGHSTRSPSPD